MISCPQNTLANFSTKSEAHLEKVTSFCAILFFDPRSLIRGCVNFGSGAVSGCEPLRFYPPPIPTTLTRAEERGPA